LAAAAAARRAGPVAAGTRVPGQRHPEHRPARPPAACRRAMRRHEGGHWMSRVAAALLALTVGCVLADSAVVTLALPEILVRLHATVGQIAWVLIAFNLVLAVVARPAAWFYARLNP